MGSVEYVLSRVNMTEDRVKELVYAVLKYITEVSYMEYNDQKHAVLDIFEELSGKEAAELVKLMRKDVESDE